MSRNDTDRARELARNLVEILSSYEEELMGLEQGSPAITQLRRAVGMTIAEACYWISDEGSGRDDWAPPADDEARRAR
ncbi:MAG: hypothetical protein JWQ46_1426 [Phenylobacterium sp.]|jgi:hypothetical protein|nr:hypothetical protein [Phenylobacterium sp.]MDB5466664.1 hypothetical protein [Phenylobacterium sp.]